jgi:hypothetical protein
LFDGEGTELRRSARTDEWGHSIGQREKLLAQFLHFAKRPKEPEHVAAKRLLSMMSETPEIDAMMQAHYTESMLSQVPSLACSLFANGVVSVAETVPGVRKQRGGADGAHARVLQLVQADDKVADPQHTQCSVADQGGVVSEKAALPTQAFKTTLHGPAASTGQAQLGDHSSV